jgi:hypothetical protein
MRLILALGGLIGMAALLSLSVSAEAKITTNKITTNKITTNSLAGNRLIGGGAVTDVSGIELPNGVRITR